MTSNPWIDGSRQAYARLLKLYPQEHREKYGADMVQVFGDQCREAYAGTRGWGLLRLWLRTLPDLGISSLREQITAPNFAAGMLEAVPGRPLPWKGVLLVLLPGLVFLVSQVAQLNGDNWFVVVLYRGAYFLILPVLLVWVLRRKFPVWGLIPLGMLFRTVWSFIFNRFMGGFFTLRLSLGMSNFQPLYYYLSNAFRIVNQVLKPINGFLQENYTLSAQIAALFVLVLLVALVVIAWRRGRFSKAGWTWLGLGVATCLAGTLLEGYPYLQAIGSLQATKVAGPFLQMATWQFLDLAQVLLIVMAGTLLLRRYGSLALLLPLGYMIPSVMYGQVAPENSLISFVFIWASVLAYRIILTLIAPVWILRSASAGGQKRAFGVALLAALFISVALNTLSTLNYVLGTLNPDMTIFFFSIRYPLLNVAGIGLALALYRSSSQAIQPGPSPHLEPAESTR